MFTVGQKIQIKKPDTQVKDELLSQEAVAILQNCNFVGEVSQVQDGLIYVGFKDGSSWLTQVFKPEEIEGV